MTVYVYAVIDELLNIVATSKLASVMAVLDEATYLISCETIDTTDENHAHARMMTLATFLDEWEVPAPYETFYDAGPDVAIPAFHAWLLAHPEHEQRTQFANPFASLTPDDASARGDKCEHG